MTKLLSCSLIRSGLTLPATSLALVGFTLALATAAALPAAPAPFAQQQQLALRSAKPTSDAAPQRYGRMELTLDLAATYDNPFNPDEIDVWGLFTSPKGQTMRVNGFLDQPFTRRLDHDAEKIEPAGAPAWKLRFAPPLEGTWRYRVFAKDRSGETSLPEASFTVGPSKNPGFIRRAEHNPGMFAFDNGQPYFAIGENMCWGGKRGSYDYDDWLPPLAKAGGNWIRIWMSSWNCALEWSREAHGDWRNGQYHGVGLYSLDNAWKLDTILDLAETNGVAVMLCFGTYGEFNTGGYFNEGQWKANPYNATNGGPCLKPADFWTNATARQLYRQRLRYLTARYASRAGIQSWEFWNEANAPAAWVGEMARCLKGTGEFAGRALDPYAHLVTTTYGTPTIWRLPEVDFTQTHHYGKGDVPDHAPIIHRDALAHTSYGKPHLMGEFGIDWRTADEKYDPEGRAFNLHNGLWASALSGNAGSAMIWYWDGYVHPHQLYSQFTPLREFANAVPWTDTTWKPLALRFESYSLTGNQTVERAAPQNLYGLHNGRMAILWAQNAAHNWKNLFDKKHIAPVPSTRVSCVGLPPGPYSVEWWDTWKGGMTRKESVSGTSDGITLVLPELESDVAARIVPAN